MKQFGCLDNFSCFPFENKLGELKKLVRKPQFPLQQLVRRLCEIENNLPVSSQFSNETCAPTLKAQHFSGLLPDVDFVDAKQFRKIKTEKLSLSLSDGNNCIMTEKGVPYLIHNILEHRGSIILLCYEFLHISDVFDYPMPSNKIGMFSCRKLASEYLLVPLSRVCCKCTCFPEPHSQKHSSSETNFIVMCLLHHENN